MFDLPLNVAAILADFKFDWFIAGGWAIDLYVGKETRFHNDVEIAIFREEQLFLQNYLSDWNLRKVAGKALTSWIKGEFLETPIHEIHCFNQTATPQNLEVLLNERSGSNWVYRRNQSITKLLTECYLLSNNNIRFLCPEIVLLYKSKNPREKDAQDFELVSARLETERKNWLKNALTICHPEHDWLRKL